MLEERKQEWISAYVDGELSPSDCGTVEQWLEVEPSCREFHRELLELRRDFDSLFVAMPEDALGRDLSVDILSLIESLPAPERSISSIAESETRRTIQVGTDLPSSRFHSVVLRLAALAAALALAVCWALPDESWQSLATKPDIPKVTPMAGGPDGDPPNVADAPNVGLTRPRSPDADFVAARPASFILVEVELTAKGLSHESMNAALQQAAIGQANGVPIDNALERALTNSRFFQNVDDGKEELDKNEKPADDGRARLEGMVYCVLNGPQLDTIWDYLAKEKGAGALSNMAIDVVFLDNDLSLFDMLHRSAEFQIADVDATQPVPTDVAAPLRLRAQRILLSAALQTKLGRGLRVLAVPAVSLLSGVLKNDGNANEVGAEEGEERGDAPEVTPQQMEAMASKTTGVLFIVRSSESEDAEAK